MRVTAAALVDYDVEEARVWCVKPLWSWRQTVDVIRRFSEAISSRQDK